MILNNGYLSFIGGDEGSAERALRDRTSAGIIVCRIVYILD
jgi:hypothetical protein